MNADLDDVDGKLRLTVFHNGLTDIAADFTADDVLGAFKWRPATPLQESFNVVRGSTPTRPTTRFISRSIIPRLPRPARRDRACIRDGPADGRARQSGPAPRVGVLKRQKFGGTFEAEFQATAWAVQKNSVVTLTFPSWASRTSYSCGRDGLRVDGVVPLVLREEDAAIGDAPSHRCYCPGRHDPHDPALDPIIDAINSAGSDIPAI